MGATKMQDFIYDKKNQLILIKKKKNGPKPKVLKNYL